MSNLTDALIAAKLIGAQGGGSGGGSGLPEITTEPVEILAEQNVNFSDQDGMYMGGVSGQYSINVGDNITVAWDGVPYDCVASELNSLAAWGNLSIAGPGSDTGEPFAMICMPGNGIEMATRSGEVHTVSISGVSFNPPAGSTLIVKDGEWTPIIPSKHPVSEIEVTIATTQSIPANSLVEINWNIIGTLPPGFSSGVLYGAIVIKNGTIRPLLIIGEISASPKTLHGYAMNLSSSAIADTLPTLKGLLYF